MGEIHELKAVLVNNNSLQFTDVLCAHARICGVAGNGPHSPGCKRPEDSLRVLFHQTLNVDTGPACTSAPQSYQSPLSAETKVKILMVRM